MKYLFSVLLPMTLAVVLVSGCNPGTGGSSKATEVPETDLQKRSYALGHNMGGTLESAGIEYDQAYYNAGFSDAAEGVQRMTAEDMQAAMIAMQQDAQQKQMEKQQVALEENKKVATDYLAVNAEKEGVITTDSGLQYQIIAEGDGEKPTASDTVTVHYEGRLVDGQIFDSSLQRGEPATFPLGGVIAGWTEALQLMPVGSKWQLTIPPELGYGERGAGGKIGPNAVLIFDVELLDIKQPE